MGIAGSNRHRDRAASKPGAKSPSAGRNGRKSSTTATFEFTIPSELSATRDVHKTIMDEVERHKYTETSAFAIRLALEEGLMNAVKHGNKLAREKTVHVLATVTAKQTQITIEDQGAGFERSNVPDPCSSENLLKCSGRGILLMESYMDKVEFSNGGRRVKMIKKNT